MGTGARCTAPQNRASGRTTEQVCSLRRGDVYVCHTRSMTEYARRLAAVRIPHIAPAVRFMTFAAGHDAISALRGTRCRVVADHACPPDVRSAVRELSLLVAD